MECETCKVNPGIEYNVNGELLILCNNCAFDKAREGFQVRPVRKEVE